MRVLIFAAVATNVLATGAWAADKAASTAVVVASPGLSDWRIPDAQNLLVIDTNKGRIIFELAPSVAPASVARVKALTRSGLYNGRSFFRVVDNFMDQTGDPLDTGAGGSALPNLPSEFTFRRGADIPLAVVAKEAGIEAGFVGTLPVISQTMDLGLLTADQKVKAFGTFCAGVGGMARAEDAASGNSQFFLMRGPTTNLDQKYTPFGRVIAGMDVVAAIKLGEPVPVPQDKMLKVRVLADIPPAERPTVRVIDGASPWFAALVARVRAAKGADFGLCNLDFPTEVK